MPGQDSKQKHIGKVSEDTNPLTASGVLILDVLLHIKKNEDKSDPKPFSEGDVCTFNYK